MSRETGDGVDPLGLEPLTSAGLTEEEARVLVDAHGGSVEAAMNTVLGLALGATRKADEVADNFADSIVSRAEAGTKAEKSEGVWRTLSGGARLGTGDDDSGGGGEASPTTPTPNAQQADLPQTELRVEVIFFADGFTVEEEQRAPAAAAASLPPSSSSRKTGIVTLRDTAPAASASLDRRRRRPPRLRAFDTPTNRIFLAQLNRNQVPPEFRRLDDNGRPVRVRFAVADARPAKCPWATSAASRGGDDDPGAANASDDDDSDDDEDDDEAFADHHKAAWPKQEPAEAGAGAFFAGAGHRLVDDAPPSAEEEAPSFAPPPTPVLDTSKPKTTLVLRLHDNRRVRAELNLDHTVGHLHALVRDHGADGAPYSLLAGFPPKALDDPALTLEAGHLSGASIQQKLRR